MNGTHTFMLASSVVGAAAVFAWRMRESKQPLTLRKIVIPPLGMSTGFAMFAYPPARIPWSWAGTAFAIGLLLLSYPLMRTTTLHREGDIVRMKRSRAFLWILLGLVAVRWSARAYVEQYVSAIQTGGIFFVLAFGMIVRWRADMYVQYKKLVGQLPSALGQG